MHLRSMPRLRMISPCTAAIRLIGRPAKCLGRKLKVQWRWCIPRSYSRLTSEDILAFLLKACQSFISILFVPVICVFKLPWVELLRLISCFFPFCHMARKHTMKWFQAFYQAIYSHRSFPPLLWFTYVRVLWYQTMTTSPWRIQCFPFV